MSVTFSVYSSVLFNLISRVAIPYITSMTRCLMMDTSYVGLKLYKTNTPVNVSGALTRFPNGLTIPTGKNQRKLRLHRSTQW